MPEVIITGATGVIGMALVNKCIDNGIKVTVIVNPNSNRIDRIPNHPLVRVIACSVDDYDSFNDGLDAGFDAGFDAGVDSGVGDTVEDAVEDTKSVEAERIFFHLAWKGTFGDARNDMSMQQANVQYTLDAVRLAKRLGCSCFVGVGSQAEYGRVEGLLSAKTKTNPENAYGISKLDAGEKSRVLCHELGMKHIWTRVLSIYGPYDGKKTMVMSLIDSLLQGRKPSLTKGEQMWDYLYSEDAANALLLAGQKGVDGRIYPIGSGTARPLREYIEIIRDMINPDIELGFGDIPYSDKQVMYLCADISELNKDTAFTVTIPFEEGIRRTIEYMKIDS